MIGTTFVRRWLASKARANINPTQHIANRVRLPRTRVVYHGVPDVVPVARHGHEGLPCFAFVGRLVREKGVPVLLRAACQLRDAGYSFKLRIIGDGPDRQSLEKMAQQNGLGSYIDFVGSVPTDTIPEFLKDTLAVIMPALWEDVAPLAASEQLMQGSLIIAADVGGLAEIVDSAGLKFPVGDATALERCMRRVLEDPVLVQTLRAKARQRGLECFGEVRMAKDHLRIYEAVAASSEGDS